ncbi:hypothetical protein Tco_0237221 [Tanacetum coccineum]
MTTVNQGMSVEEIERVVAQRVANAIVGYCHIRTKKQQHGRKSISQTEQQESKFVKNANNKRKWEGNHNGNETANSRLFMSVKSETLQGDDVQKSDKQQQQIKRQNTGRAYTAGSGDKKPYGGSRPLCSKCNYHHDGPCAPKCYKCNKYGHIARTVRGTEMPNAVNNPKGHCGKSEAICYDVGIKGTTRGGIAQKRKNQSLKTKIRVLRAHEWSYLKTRRNQARPNNQ